MFRRSRPDSLPIVNIPVVIGTVVLTVALVAAGIRQARPAWFGYTGTADVNILTPSLTGEPELCLTCHDGIAEISEAHPTEVFGCVICHGGDPLSLDEAAVHEGMIGGNNPADLAVAAQGCGGADCHTGSHEGARDHVARVEKSIQASYAGAINQVLVSSGVKGADGPFYGMVAVEDDAPENPENVVQLLAFDPAGFSNALIGQFSENCLTCHLSAEPIQQTYYYRGTGCAACHVLYGANGLYQGDDPTIPKDEPGHPQQHRLTTQIPFTTCNACHNKGQYSVEEMAFSPRTDIPAPHELSSDPNQRRLDQYYDGRPFTQCEWELDCVDCHTTREAMGDGNIYVSQFDAEKTQCKTCHGTLDELPTFIEITDPDDPTLRRASLNPFYDVNLGTLVLLAPDGDTLGAVQLIGDQVVQIGKVTGKRFIVPMVQGSACEQDVHQQEAQYCHECHAYDSP